MAERLRAVIPIASAAYGITLFYIGRLYPGKDKFMPPFKNLKSLDAEF